MPPLPHPAPFSAQFELCDGDLLCASLFDDRQDQLTRAKLEVALFFIPGAERFLARFSGFLQRLPDPASPDRTLLSSAVSFALDRIEPLGLSPISVEAHVKGFPVLVGAALPFVDRAFLMAVESPVFGSWNPCLGPLGAQGSKGAPVSVRSSDSEVPAYLRHWARIVCLSHCLSFAQLSGLAHSWESLSPRPTPC